MYLDNNDIIEACDFCKGETYNYATDSGDRIYCEWCEKVLCLSCDSIAEIKESSYICKDCRCKGKK